ncbi:hypothetical protein M422DRAFT_249231 [Sphaerobolus stellatus SS14]|uniref:Uncharacterized protein n=1 Tax=Sphaerobolus stellatus (strain SS14) TaxID=990650 RepID=A0A0C9VV67_SPHS4|nr:hypothetical protein M422DRAFT_249231 [Sphaerobolus stellatus SS14]
MSKKRNHCHYTPTSNGSFASNPSIPGSGDVRVETESESGAELSASSVEVKSESDWAEKESNWSDDGNEEQLRLTSIQSMEYKLNGPAHHADRHNPQTQEHKKKLKEDAAASDGLITGDMMAKQLEAVDPEARKPSSSQQLKIFNFLRRGHSPAPSLSAAPLPKRQHTDNGIEMSMSTLDAPQDTPQTVSDFEDIIENIISSDDEELLPDIQDQEEEVDEAQKWIEVLDKDMLSTPQDFHTLTLEKLRIVCKKKIYKAELWFTSLFDFYC